LTTDNIIIISIDLDILQKIFIFESYTSSYLFLLLNIKNFLKEFLY